MDLSFATRRAPNILERDLGYEIGGGIDWKLIEGYTLTARVAYWKPGGWFKYACVDRRQPNWDIAPTASNMWGINPNREIDPIFGMRVASSGLLMPTFVCGPEPAFRLAVLKWTGMNFRGEKTGRRR